MQFIQVVFYFNAHPRMAVLYKTLETSAQDMIHFLMLFVVLTLFLAMMAYYQFGDHLEVYSTISGSMQSHVLMIFGDFLLDEQMARLNSMQSVCYWLYAMTFLIITFFILTNFFLAIVVEAFVQVQEEIKAFKAENSFTADIQDMGWNFIYYNLRRSWPRPKEMTKFLERRGDLKPQSAKEAHGLVKVIVNSIICDGLDDFCTDLLSAKELLNAFPGFTEDSMVSYITFYANKMEEEAELVQAEKPEEEAVDGPRAVLFAEVAAKCVEEAALEMRRKPDLPLHLLASRMCSKMVETFAEEEAARKAKDTGAS
jgi:hypothetical protein